MKFGLDRYADLDSPIHRWEQRSKLVALIALIFAFAFVNRLIVLPAMILVSVLLYGLSRLPLSFLFSRLHYPGLFILAVVIFLPFAAGNTVLFELGPVHVKREGVEAVLLIATRFLCIITVSLVLFGTAPFLTTLKAMRSLRLPEIIVDMTLLSYRYLEEFGETQKTMRRATQLRGLNSDRFNWHTVRVLAGLAGSLLIRCYDRSEQVYQAMRLRGYGRSITSKSKPEFAPDLSQANLTSQVAFWLTLFVATGFVAAEVFL